MKATFALIVSVLVIAVVAVMLAPKRPAGPVKRYRVVVPDEMRDEVRCPPSPLPPLAEAPKVLRRVEPALPPQARRMRITGDVILRVGIRPDGSVGGVCVLKPLPGGLNTAAIQAVKQWRFEPRRENAIADVTVHFAPSTAF